MHRPEGASGSGAASDLPRSIIVTNVDLNVFDNKMLKVRQKAERLAA